MRFRSLILIIALMATSVEAAALHQADMRHRSLVDLVDQISSKMPIDARSLEDILHTKLGDWREWHSSNESIADYVTAEGYHLHIFLLPPRDVTGIPTTLRVTLLVSEDPCVKPGTFRASFAHQTGINWTPKGPPGTFYAFPHGHYVSVDTRWGNKCFAAVHIDELRGQPALGPPGPRRLRR